MLPCTHAQSSGYFSWYPLEDQRLASRRPDVLVYETEPLAEDLTLADPINTALQIASAGTDADFIVLIDPNPLKFVPNINTANASDFQRATMTVFRDAGRASYLVLPMLPARPDVP